MNHQNNEQRLSRPERATRQPYQRPAIEQTSEFETLTLACGLADTSCNYTGGVSAS